MKNEEVEWGWVIGFFLLVLLGVWIALVSSGHAPIFDFYEEYGFFEFNTLFGGIVASLVTFVIMGVTLITTILVIFAFFTSIKETFKAGRYGINYVKEKIRSSRKAEKAAEEGSGNSKGMGDQRNL